MNHLDPNKLHSTWTPAEDLQLLECLRENGNKWSAAVRTLNGTRTEHMVKNRYKSLVGMESKKHKSKSVDEIELALMKKLRKNMAKTKINVEP